MIELKNVYKSYQSGPTQVTALNGLSMSIPPLAVSEADSEVAAKKENVSGGGGLFGVMGPSGSGKSTLLHLLAGLDKPDRGEVSVAGQRLDQSGESELTRYRRTRIGVVFQQFNLISSLSAIQNIGLPAVVDGRDKKWIKERSEHLLDLFGLKERAHHRPEALSGGEQQRVAIARALLFSPPVILADEPTGNLDTRASEKVWSLLAEIPKKEKVLILMITHEPAGAAYCDHIHVMKDGNLTGSFEVGEMNASGVANRYQQLEG